MKTVKLGKTLCVIQQAEYTNDRICLMAINKRTHDLYADITVNLPDEKCGKDEVFIDVNHLKPESVKALQEAGIIGTEVIRTAQSGFVTYPCYKILNEKTEAKHTAGAKIQTSSVYEYFSSGSIGGCGYDKESTAFANAVNQSRSMLKALFRIKEKSVNTKNHELFGYGSGYGILPHFEGGMGVSCFPRIFEKLGLEMKQTGNGKAFNVYSIEPMKKSRNKAA